MQEPGIQSLFQTILKAEFPLSFFGDEMPTEAISEKSYWTKSLRDSLELTELVMLRGMRWCAALDRRREGACWPHTVIDGKQG
jgi:hypothetical protein